VRAGFDAWIAKPINERKLRTALLHVAEDLAVLPRRPVPAPAPAPVGRQRSRAAGRGQPRQPEGDGAVLRRMGFEVETASNGRARHRGRAQQRFARDPDGLSRCP
jgi:hypothetical protein